LAARRFDDGELVAEIIPERWLMNHYDVQLSAPYKEEGVDDVVVLTTPA
jgi:hypothetical protein